MRITITLTDDEEFVRVNRRIYVEGVEPPRVGGEMTALDVATWALDCITPSVGAVELQAALAANSRRRKVEQGVGSAHVSCAPEGVPPDDSGSAQLAVISAQDLFGNPL